MESNDDRIKHGVRVLAAAALAVVAYVVDHHDAIVDVVEWVQRAFGG